MTHARLRAVQGDTEGAKRILREILSSRPDCEPAQTLLRTLSTAVPGATSPAAFRLLQWLERIQRSGRSEPAR